jgi:hypothetical protein
LAFEKTGGREKQDPHEQRKYFCSFAAPIFFFSIMGIPLSAPLLVAFIGRPWVLPYSRGYRFFLVRPGQPISAGRLPHPASNRLPAAIVDFLLEGQKAPGEKAGAAELEGSGCPRKSRGGQAGKFPDGPSGGP